jgi:signal transduction histidine kinase
LKKLFLFSIVLLFFGCNSKEEIGYSKTKLESYFNKIDENDLDKSLKIKYLDSVNTIIENFKEEDSLKIKNYFKVANRYFRLQEYDNYYNTTNKVLQLGTFQKDSSAIAKADYYLGDYYFFTSKNDSAYLYYVSAEKKYRALKDELNLANVLLHKSNILLFEKDFLGSESQTIKALNIAKKEKDNELIYECYVNLGSSLAGLKNYEAALQYHNKALNQIDKIEIEHYKPILKAQTYNNIGFVYLNLNKYDQAIKIFLKGLEVENIKELHPALYSSLLDYLAYSKFKNNKNEGFREFSLALKISDSINDISGKIINRIHLTEYYLSHKDTIRALKLNTEANNLAKEVKYNKDVLLTLDLFTKADPKNGLKYAKQYISLNDSLNDIERATRNKLARIEFETDEIIQEKELLTEQNKTILLTFIVLSLFGLLFYIILYLRSKHRTLIFEQEQQKANEEIYRIMLNQQFKLDEARNIEKNRIAKELHDGVMNKLTSTRLNLFVLSKRRDDETIQNCINYINDIQNIEKEVRTIAHELNNDKFLKKNSFEKMLKELLYEQNKLFSAETKYNLDAEINWDTIDVGIKMNLYRIIQEALNNCNKYAEAKEIVIRISKNENKTIILSIEDNGIGFNTNKTKKGIGIKNIYERVQAIEGKIEITSVKNEGTRIKINFPFKTKI